MRDDFLINCVPFVSPLPEAAGAGGVGNPSFKVRDKIFAMRHDLHAGQWSVWCKAAAGVQAMLVSAEPERYFVPPYVGQHGWVGIRLHDGIDWTIVADQARKSCRMIAETACRPTGGNPMTFGRFTGGVTMRQFMYLSFTLEYACAGRLPIDPSAECD